MGWIPTSGLRAPSIAVAVLAFVCSIEPGRAQPPAAGSAPVLVYSEQGWSAADRDVFYTTDQGSRMMHYAWFRALRRLDVDQPFAADKLQRYGYLPNDQSKTNPEGLPVGFVVDGSAASGEIGMTCAACHTAQLEYQKDGVTHALRIEARPPMRTSSNFSPTSRPRRARR